VCVDADGHVVGRNRAASDMLALTHGQQRPHCSDLFAMHWEHLFDAARARRPAAEQPLWSGLRLQVLASLNSGGSEAGHGMASASPTSGLKDIEAALIRQAVQAARGNVMEAARALGISRATVYRKLGRRP